MQKYSITLLLATLLASCSLAPTSTPDRPTEERETATQTLRVESATPTQTLTPSVTFTPTPDLTALAEAAVFGTDNFFQFSEVQVYRDAIESARQEQFGTLPGDGRVDAWTFSPDGRYLAVGGCTTNWVGSCESDVHAGTSYIYILDALTAELIGSIPEPDATISGLAFSPDASKLIYIICPRKAAIWDMETQQVERVFWQEKGCPSNPKATVSPDGNQIALVSDDRLLLFAMESGEKTLQLPASRYGSVFPKYSADGSRLAVYSDGEGRAITVYDTATWQALSNIALPGDGTSAVDISPDGSLIVSAESGENTDILVWDTASGTQLAVLDDPFYYVNALAFTPDGSLLLVGGAMENYNFETIAVWELSTGQRLGTLTGFDTPGRIMFARDGKSFMASGWLNDFFLWSLPDEDLQVASLAVTSFLEAMHAGDFEAAAAWFEPGENDKSYLEEAGFDTDDIPAMLEAICAQAHQPCMPLREVVYSGKQPFDQYLVTVHFTAPDGLLYHGPDDETDFWVFAIKQPDGSMRVSYPPYFFLSP